MEQQHQRGQVIKGPERHTKEPGFGLKKGVSERLVKLPFSQLVPFMTPGDRHGEVCLLRAEAIRSFCICASGKLLWWQCNNRLETGGV